MSQIEEAIQAEANEYVRRLLGELYNLIPDSVKAGLEREYINQRTAELGGQVAAVAPTAVKYVVIAGVLLGLYALSKR